MFLIRKGVYKKNGKDKVKFYPFGSSGLGIPLDNEIQMAVNKDNEYSKDVPVSVEEPEELEEPEEEVNDAPDKIQVQGQSGAQAQGQRQMGMGMRQAQPVQSELERLIHDYFGVNEKFINRKVFNKFFTINEESVEFVHPTDVPNSTPEEVEETINILYMMKVEDPNSNPNVFIWGAPGIGKSTVVQAVCRDLKLDMEELNLATCIPEDLTGFPDDYEKSTGNKLVDDEGVPVQRSIYKLPILMPYTNGKNRKGGIFFLDEMNNGREAIMRAALPLALEGRIPNAKYKLPSKWIVVAAGNRVSDVKKMQDMESRMNNRFMHINMTSDVKSWGAWAAKNNVDGDIIAFLHAYEEWFYKLDPDTTGENWPSPRSWSKASDYYITLKRYKGGRLSQKQITHTIQAFVGSAAASAFYSFLLLKDKFNTESVIDVYENGSKAKASVKGLKIDEEFAALFSIAFFKKGKKVTLKEMENVLDWSMTLKNFDETTMLIKYFRRVHPYVKTEEPYRDVYQDYLNLWHEKKYNPEFFEEIGEGK